MVQKKKSKASKRAKALQRKLAQFTRVMPPPVIPSIYNIRTLRERQVNRGPSKPRTGANAYLLSLADPEHSPAAQIPDQTVIHTATLTTRGVIPVTTSVNGNILIGMVPSVKQGYISPTLTGAGNIATGAVAVPLFGDIMSQEDLNWFNHATSVRPVSMAVTYEYIGASTADAGQVNICRVDGALSPIINSVIDLQIGTFAARQNVYEMGNYRVPETVTAYWKPQGLESYHFDMSPLYGNVPGPASEAGPNNQSFGWHWLLRGGNITQIWPACNQFDPTYFLAGDTVDGNVVVAGVNDNPTVRRGLLPQIWFTVVGATASATIGRLTITTQWEYVPTAMGGSRTPSFSDPAAFEIACNTSTLIPPAVRTFMEGDPNRKLIEAVVAAGGGNWSLLDTLTGFGSGVAAATKLGPLIGAIVGRYARNRLRNS